MDQAFDLKNLVALFLAEALRSRRTSLARAAEICSRVVAALPKATSESETLKMLTDIEKDFEEITVLKQTLHFGYNPSDAKVFEHEIKDYVAKTFAKDLENSNRFLSEASQAGMTIQQLCLKYPDFCNYLLSHTDNPELLPKI